MAALCACLAAVACGGVAGLSLAFAAYFLPDRPITPTALSGLCVMGASLPALPGVLAGEAKHATFLAVCGIAAAILFVPALPLQDDKLFHLALLAVYEVSVGVAVVLAKKQLQRTENACRLRPLAAWTLVTALAFGLMAVGMLQEVTVSQRVSLAGKTLCVVTALLCFLAFYGVLRPKLYTYGINLTLFFIWLLVPVAGIEAYMYAEGIGLPSTYAASGWKWSFAFCALGGVGAVRMILLRHDLLPSRSWLADLFT